MDLVDLIKQEVENWKEGEQKDYYSLDLNGKREHLPIIRTSTKRLLLNPHNHRLSAQIRDSENLSELETNPNSQESQKKIRQLLAATEDFTKLKGELESLGQKDPGLITRDGVLVNGNTRAAALYELAEDGKEIGKYMDIAVLPPNIGEDEIIEIEMGLQMTRLTQQDYTFTNELLVMRKYLDRNKTWQELAAKLNWQRGAERKIQKRMDILAYIEEARALSNGKLGYSNFDSKQTHLEDMHEGYTKEAANGTEQSAKQFRDEYMLGILLGLNKDHVREIQFDDDGYSYLENTFSEIEGDNSFKVSMAEKYQSELRIDDGLDDVLGVPENNNAPDASKMIKDFLSEPGSIDEEGNLRTDLDGNSSFYELANFMQADTDRLINEKRSETRAQELHLTLEQIRMQIVTVKAKMPERSGEENFKKKKFSFVLKKLKKEVTELAEQFENIIN